MESKKSLYSYSRLSSLQSIRVLHLRSSKDFNAPLKCGLEEIILNADGSNVPVYDALSYVWGERIGERPLECEGFTILITTNCESALRHLRHKKKPITLWIDAICIDQNSISERNHQVILMGNVYRMASRVLIWLGPAPPGTSGFLGRMHRLGSILDRVKIDDMWNELQDGILKVLGGLPKDELFQPIVCSPWLLRTWTAQEIILAHKPTIVCGRYVFSWLNYYIWSFAQTSRNMWTATTERVLWNQANLAVYNRHQSRVFSEDLATRDQQETLYRRVLDLVFLSVATDPRDKVYGVFAVLQLTGHELPAVNYSDSIQVIYETFARHIARELGLSLLLRFQTHDAAHTGLPSWVPNWNFRPDEERHDIFENPWHREWEEDMHAARNSTFDAALLTTARDRELPARGLAFDKVAVTGPPWPIRRLGKSDPDEFTGHWIPTMETFVAWIRLLSGQSGLTAGKINTFTEVIAMGREKVRGKWSEGYVRRAWNKLEKGVEPEHTFDEKLRDPMESVEDVIMDKVFFITEQDRMGIGCGALQAGDVVTLLKGSRVPAVLRKVGDFYTLVGACYVAAEVMNGELWPDEDDDEKAQKLETFVLV